MRRIVELDAVRGIAALAVLVFHVDHRLLPQGWLAVDLFMLLSGYLITSIVLANGQTKGFLGHFYCRRALRIWPIYYLALVTAFLLTALRHHPFLASLPYYLTFTQNVPYYWSHTAPAFPTHFVHTWSLAVEEQYYLVWPALVLLVGRRAIIPVSGALIAVCTVARGAGAHWTLLVTRCDGFALGGILAVLFSDPQLHARYRRGMNAGFWTVGILAFGVSCCLWAQAGAAAPPLVLKSVWMLAVNVSFCCALGLVIAHAGQPRLRPLRTAALCTLGRVSYGLYLYHPIVFVVVDRTSSALGVAPSTALGVVKVGGSIALTALSWRFVERPILAFKDRFRYAHNPLSTRCGEPGLPAAVEPVRDTSATASPWLTNPA